MPQIAADCSLVLDTLCSTSYNCVIMALFEENGHDVEEHGNLILCEVIW